MLTENARLLPMCTADDRLPVRGMALLWALNAWDGVYNWPMFVSELIDLLIRESPTDAPHFSFHLNLPYSDPLLKPIWTVGAAW